MKGYLAMKYADPIGEYSDLRVMKSAAGYYIGTSFTHTQGEFKGLEEPGSRESEYFATAEEARDALDNRSWTQRMNP